MEEDLNILRNVRKMIINRLKNPKFATNIEVSTSLGISDRNLYDKCEDMSISISELVDIRNKRRKEIIENYKK